MPKDSVQNCKYDSIIRPTAILDNSSWTTREIDTKGWDYAEIIFFLGATDIDITALAVTESDVTASGHANITGCVSGTSTDIAGTTTVLPAATDDNTFTVFQIDLRGRKRFLDLTATIGNGTVGGYAACFIRLSRGEIQPNTSAEAGCDFLMRV